MGNAKEKTGELATFRAIQLSKKIYLKPGGAKLLDYC